MDKGDKLNNGEIVTDINASQTLLISFDENKPGDHLFRINKDNSLTSIPVQEAADVDFMTDNVIRVYDANETPIQQSCFIVNEDNSLQQIPSTMASKLVKKESEINKTKERVEALAQARSGVMPTPKPLKNKDKQCMKNNRVMNGIRTMKNTVR